MSIIDAHIHYGDDDPALLAVLDEWGITLLNICYVQDPQDPWREQADRYGELASRDPDHFAWCTSFDLPNQDIHDNGDYVQRVISGLDQDFAVGAVACKVWKCVGMGIRDAAGRYTMVDDPIFEPIFAHVAASGRTFLMHIAEPLACWQPLTPHNPHYGYYSRNPQWHMFGRPDMTTHTDLITARDRVLARHPDLKVVGAHLGSLEYDVDQVAARLTRYPNFAVDISARLADLAAQDSHKVRRFVLDFADRILFGTDIVMGRPPSGMTEAEKSETLTSLRENYQTHFAYFESTGTVTVRGRDAQGLGLPDPVLEQLYLTNALHWYPGLAQNYQTH